MPQFLPTLDIFPGHLNKAGKVYNTNAKTKLFAEEVNAIGGRLVTGLYTVAGRNLYVGLPPAEFEAISEFGAASLASIGGAPGVVTLPITLPVSMSGFTLTGLPLVPTLPDEAASKSYVDGLVVGPFVQLRAGLIAPAQAGSWKLDGTGRIETGTDIADHTSAGFAGTDGTATFGLTVSGMLINSGVGSIGDMSSLRLLMTAGAATADVSTTAAVFNDGAANVGTYGPALLDFVSAAGAETTISTGASAAYIVGVSGFISALDADLAQWLLTNASGETATINPRNIIMADPAGTQFARLSNVDLVFDSGFGATSSISFGASFLSATGVSGFNVAMDSELAKLYLASPAASTVLGIGASALLAMGSTGKTIEMDSEAAQLTITNPALTTTAILGATLSIDGGIGYVSSVGPDTIAITGLNDITTISTLSVKVEGVGVRAATLFSDRLEYTGTGPVATASFSVGAGLIAATGASGRTTAMDSEVASLTFTRNLDVATLSTVSLDLADGSNTASYQVSSVLFNGTKVIGLQQAAIADATGAGDVVAQLNLLLAACRNHGLIAP